MVDNEVKPSATFLLTQGPSALACFGHHRQHSCIRLVNPLGLLAARESALVQGQNILRRNYLKFRRTFFDTNAFRRYLFCIWADTFLKISQFSHAHLFVVQALLGVLCNA
jgi:hypothetical protein